MTKRVPTVTVLQGLPASGKSTFARQLSDETGAIRINLDEIRLMMGFGQGTGKWTKILEKVAFETQIRALVTAVDQGHDVVIDNTHMVKSMPEAYKVALSRHVVKFIAQSFLNVPREVCIERDAKREGQVPVGVEVIDKLWANGQRAAQGGWRLTTEWLNEPIGFVPFEDRPVETYVAKPGTPKAILVDLDGTLFIHNGRGPHEYHRVEEDLLNEAVAEEIRLRAAAGYAILLASGRPEKVAKTNFDVRAATKRALAKHKVFYDHLWMRTAGDFRKDTVVKLEIFDAHIRDHYDIRLCLDDRNAVVDQYRDDLGLPVWQCNNGAF